METVASFMRPHDAHLFRIKLEAEGIPAEVSDDATVSVAPFLANAVGGVRVVVPEEYVSQVKELLAEEEQESVDLREELVCPECGSSDIAQALNEKRSYLGSFLILILMMIPCPLIKRRYQCNHCGHLWR